MLTVLIADDEPHVVDLVRVTLEDERVRVLAAEDAAGALLLAGALRPDLLLVDVGLPDRSGLEVCAELKREPELAAMKIVMLTAAAQEADVRRGLTAVPADDLAMAYRRLNASYQQTLRYAEDVRRLYQQVQRSVYQSLLGLANALEAKDAYTRGHSERVGAWSGQAALALGLAREEAELIGQAGLLHDLGKIGVPEAGPRT